MMNKDKIFTIVQLDQIEFVEWLKLWQGYQQFYKVSLSESLTTYTWQRLCDLNRSNMYGFAAMVDQTAVGIVHVIEHESCWTERPYAYLQDLFTDEHYRGQGIAKALIEAVQQKTQERGCDRVYWLTHETNEAARALYDQVATQTGFIQYRLK